MSEKKPLEERAFLCEVRAEQSDEGSVITGRPIVYNSRTDLGWFDEIIESGALERTDLRDVRFLVNHDFSKLPLARSRRNNGNSTMLLSVDEEGMTIKAKLDTENNPEAKALWSAVSRNDITGMSFAFSVNGEKWDDLESEHPTRRITDIGTVVEVSAVTFPAYEATSIQARNKEALDNARSALDKARKESLERELELLKEKTKLLGGL